MKSVDWCEIGSWLLILQIGYARKVHSHGLMRTSDRACLSPATSCMYCYERFYTACIGEYRMIAEASAGLRSTRGLLLNTLFMDHEAWKSSACNYQRWWCFYCSSLWPSSCLRPYDCVQRAERYFYQLASRLLSAWCCLREGTFCNSRSMIWGGIVPY